MNKWRRKRSIMMRYDLTAHMYDQRYAEEQEAKYKAGLEVLAVAPTGLILDVGCGSGLFFPHVADNAEALVGVDISRQLLIQAKNRARSFSNIFVVCADADHLPLRQGLFSFIFAFTLIQNMPAPSVTLKEIAQIGNHHACFVVTALKRAVDLETLSVWLRHSGLCAISLRDDELLKCNVVVAVKA
ncbi:MAG: methyltransferase domain-containing protein [Candidatus Bathyarchaeota archaeon]|nr:methyltransferase domain-containing protein [Candidatus Bathyarchaeota archaeon]